MTARTGATALTPAERQLAELARLALDRAPDAPPPPRLFGPADTPAAQVLRAGRTAYLQGCLAAILALAATWYHAGEAPELGGLLREVAGEPGRQEDEVLVPGPSMVAERVRAREDAERLLRAMADRGA